MIKRIAGIAGIFVAAFALQSLYAQNAPRQYVMSADSVKFTPLDPANPGGVNISVVSGDLKGKGPITLFLRLPKGPAPLHTHTSSYYGIVVRGQAKHWAAGAEAQAQTLGPGSHWYQPGKAVHGDECLSNECVLLVQMDGPYDFAVAGK
jgi:quercetin dioxygenase-like cupin family protein